uniref:Homeobox domain-containing protein n=1 Tax=Pyxicephalus adspersus TaxID=30357 RepID=A0AAV3AX42_PYXAD|nr:TPA: hypothetical protein GDO54_000314 [Pyxicephalus adspersus]
MSALSAWFWNERFWLPQNVTWADLADTENGEQYPRAGHLFYAFPIALGIFVLRLLFERIIAKPCAIRLGLQGSGPRKAQPNSILEKVFTSITKCPDGKHLEGLSKQLDWDTRKIQRWFRHRRNQDKPSLVTKFSESMWRFIFYLYIFSYGICFLWSAPWFWDTRQCWYNYPYQPLTTGLYYYYIQELAFYWSLMFSQFIDIKRKAAKMTNYAKYQKLCDTFFMMFGLLFVTTRLVIFPTWILNTTMFESWELIGPYPSWWLFNGLLLILQVLNVVWSCLVIRLAYRSLTRGKVIKDDRSDIESSSEEEDMAVNGTKRIHNTSSNGANRVNGHAANGQWADE